MIKNYIQTLYPILSPGQDEGKVKISNVILFIFALCACAAASFVFLYSDMVDMVTNSNLLLQAIFEGKFLEYYTYTLEHSTSAFAANYDFPLYLIFAIWNLPFALIFNFQANGIVFLWFKVLIVLCIAACACIMYRIYKVFDKADGFSRGTFLFLMFSSPLVFLSEFVAGQYDCISMVLILAGVYAYLKGWNKRTLLFFSLAVPIKTFALFLFIPLLVYREKNIIKILLKTVCALSIPFFCKLLFQSDPAYAFLLGAQNRDATALLMDATVTIAAVEIHVFLMLFLALCFLCYFCRYDPSKVLLICAAVYTSFILFVPIRSYWVFLAEPFLILLITTRPKLYRVNSLIHAAAGISGSVFFLYFHGIYNSGYMTRSLGLLQIANLPTVVKYGSFSNFINVHGWDAYMPLLRTVFIGSCALLIIINALDPEKIVLSSDFPPNALSWMKCFLIMGILCVMIFVEVYPCALPVIDTLNYAESEIRPYLQYTAEANQPPAAAEEIKVLSVPDANAAEEKTPANYYSADLYAGAVIEQPFQVTAQRTVSNVCFQCYNTYPSRWSRARLSVSILDAASRQIMAETIVGAALISTGEIYTADIGETMLPEGSYLISIAYMELPPETPHSGAPIFMMCNPQDFSAAPAVINGETMEFPVCVCVN